VDSTQVIPFMCINPCKDGLYNRGEPFSPVAGSCSLSLCVRPKRRVTSAALTAASGHLHFFDFPASHAGSLAASQDACVPKLCRRIDSMDGAAPGRPPDASACGRPSAPSVFWPQNAKHRATNNAAVPPKPIPKPSILDQLAYLGAFNGERRWRSPAGDRLYTWDSLHGEVEVFNKRGRHLGAVDPITGTLLKVAVPGRKINV